MTQLMKKMILVLIVVGLLFGFGFLVKNQEIRQKNDIETPKMMKIGGIILNIEVADTDTERIQGLSSREARQNDPIGLGLGKNEGLLFVFEKEGYYGIWMKDMNFPIDIAWLNKDKKITHIEKNVSPETYPKVFYALKENNPILNLYVLEVNAGFFEKSKIKIGDLAEF